MRRVATIATTVYFSLIVLPATAFAKGGGSGGRGGGGGSKSGGRSSGYRGGSSGGHGVSGSSSTYPSFMTWLCLGLVSAVIIGVVVWGIKKKNAIR
ncbi:hypothetical protein AB0M43_13495 [Longispora sp. NPDC051575]|uniref:hypothetical protein n=1 Tax=Longispora sp. NPDC051575 TaxID=3154943 RepID=UPI003414992D